MASIPRETWNQTHFECLGARDDYIKGLKPFLRPLIVSRISSTEYITNYSSCRYLEWSFWISYSNVSRSWALVLNSNLPIRNIFLPGFHSMANLIFSSTSNRIWGWHNGFDSLHRVLRACGSPYEIQSSNSNSLRSDKCTHKLKSLSLELIFLRYSYVRSNTDPNQQGGMSIFDYISTKGRKEGRSGCSWQVLSESGLLTCRHGSD